VLLQAVQAVYRGGGRRTGGGCLLLSKQYHGENKKGEKNIMVKTRKVKRIMVTTRKVKTRKVKTRTVKTRKAKTRIMVKARRPIKQPWSKQKALPTTMAKQRRPYHCVRVTAPQHGGVAQRVNDGSAHSGVGARFEHQALLVVGDAVNTHDLPHDPDTTIGTTIGTIIGTGGVQR
jgi:hypothetical protein